MQNTKLRTNQFYGNYETGHGNITDSCFKKGKNAMCACLRKRKIYTKQTMRRKMTKLDISDVGLFFFFVFCLMNAFVSECQKPYMCLAKQHTKKKKLKGQNTKT